MHDIVIIESFRLTDDEDIQVTAILENMDASIESRRDWIAPTVAPVRCRTTVSRHTFPVDIILQGMDEVELEDMVNRYADITHLEWEALIPKFRDVKHIQPPNLSN